MVLYVLELEENKVRKARLEDYMEVIYALISLVEPGKVTTYGSIAKLLGISPRLVGKIMAANKSPIVIPCHRVVKSNGDLGGYSRGGVKIKKRLLELEGVVFSRGEVVDKKCIIDLKELLDP
ncbi:MGMT family protein [Desulfurococcaceae archaeon MEX13E-LK6-19]|nr:MGMT family protein [Desulfurococcaceae archaeon MEX13E-LK6-19]